MPYFETVESLTTLKFAILDILLKVKWHENIKKRVILNVFGSIFYNLLSFLSTLMDPNGERLASNFWATSFLSGSVYVRRRSKNEFK